MGSTVSDPGPRAVHLCVDMQNLFAPGGPWATPWMDKVLPAVVELVAHAPERTVFTRFIPPKSASEARGMWREYYRKWNEITRERLKPDLLDLVPALQRFAPPAAVVDRGVYSAFGGRLLPVLTERHVDTLIVSGGETDVCVLSTVLSAVDLGYRVILVKGALCSSSDQSHDAILGLYGAGSTSRSGSKTSKTSSALGTRGDERTGQDVRGGASPAKPVPLRQENPNRRPGFFC
jgi:nicotinamidase-related amidase